MSESKLDDVDDVSFSDGSHQEPPLRRAASQPIGHASDLQMIDESDLIEEELDM